MALFWDTPHAVLLHGLVEKVEEWKYRLELAVLLCSFFFFGIAGRTDEVSSKM